MALQKMGTKRIVGNILCTVHLLVTWIYWELGVKSMKCIPHPTGQRWGDKVRWDYENCQQIDKTLPVTTSTDAMDTEEGDAITKMILDKTKIKARDRCREGQG